jgi:hypothetical protein
LTPPGQPSDDPAARMSPETTPSWIEYALAVLTVASLLFVAFAE